VLPVLLSASLRNARLPLILVAHGRQQQGGVMAKKLTDRQKSRLWEQQRNVNFQASRRLEGVECEEIKLSADEANARIEALRGNHER